MSNKGQEKSPQLCLTFIRWKYVKMKMTLKKKSQKGLLEQSLQAEVETTEGYHIRTTMPETQLTKANAGTG